MLHPYWSKYFLLYPTLENCLILSFELKSYSFLISVLTELSKPCTLSLTTMHKNTEQRENREVSRWLSHPKHRITYTYILYWFKIDYQYLLLSHILSPQLIKITWSLHPSLSAWHCNYLSIYFSILISFVNSFELSNWAIIIGSQFGLHFQKLGAFFLNFWSLWS